MVKVVTDKVQSEVFVTASDVHNVSNDISSSMLGVLFPHNPSDIQACSQQFNLEFLENNFVSNLIGTVDTENIDTIAHEVPPITAERDILRDAVGEIVNDCPCPDNKISEQNNSPAKSVRKGRKRGRKLGYRSENSNSDIALCGVCGAKVRIIQFSGGAFLMEFPSHIFSKFISHWYILVGWPPFLLWRHLLPILPSIFPTLCAESVLSQLDMLEDR